MLDFVKRMIDQPAEFKERFYPAKAHQDGMTTSLSVLFIPNKNYTTVSVYNNRDVLGECLVRVDLDPNNADYQQQVGAAIITALEK